MKLWMIVFLTMAPCLMGVNVVQAADQLHFPFVDGAWEYEGTGLHEGWVDRRDLFVLHHPWQESKAGDRGTVSCEAKLPDNTTGPFKVHFYMTDDYDGQYPTLEADSWLGQCNLIGHRFKQLLVNGNVVWERDVADAEGGAEPSRYAVELPKELNPGDIVRIAFRLVDKRSSRERDAEDFRHIGSTDQIEETDPWKFMTNVYLGDVVITNASVENLPGGSAPSARLVRNRHETNGVPISLSPPVQFPVTLQVENAGCAQGTQRVVSCGIPFPRGKIQDLNSISLKESSGEQLVAQLSEMNRWPDGSLRWVFVNALLDCDCEEVVLDVIEQELPNVSPENPVSVEKLDSGAIEINSGRFTLSFDKPTERFSGRLIHGEVKLENLTGVIELEDETVFVKVESVKIISPGPVRGEVELMGTFSTERGKLGRFVYRVALFADQPWARVTWRIFNDRPETLQVSGMNFEGHLKDLSAGETIWSEKGKSDVAGIQVQQLRENGYEVLAGKSLILEEGDTASGWLGWRTGNCSIVAAVRHFSEQFPKAIELADGRLRIALFEASEENPHYLPTEGEAKRHEMWIGLWPKSLSASELTAHADSVLRPARLFNAKYFCETEGNGPAAIHDEKEFADLDAYMKKVFPQVDPQRFTEYGIRNWGDQYYDREKNFWSNGYYDRQQGYAAEYLMSGDPRWFDRLEAMVRHVMDIDICHASKEHPDWVGSIHGYSSPNHTDGPPWKPQQRTKGTLAYWRFTGDIDAREAALGVADSAIGDERGIGSQSVRDHAGILYCLTAAYDETGEQKFLDAAKAVAHDALNRIDRRRGCYAEIHGNVSYRGNVPWMCAQLAEPLYDYYCQSGDVEAAIGVVGLVESILTENRTRDVLGDVFGYSHNPHFSKTSNYHILIAPAVLYAYELTGDRYYLEHARAMYRQTLQEETVNTVTNCYWNTPTLLYYLKAWGLEDSVP